MEGGPPEKPGEGKEPVEAAQIPGSCPAGREWVQHLCDKSWSQPRHSLAGQRQAGPHGSHTGPARLGAGSTPGLSARSHAPRRSPLQKPRASHALLSAERGAMIHPRTKFNPLSEEATPRHIHTTYCYFCPTAEEMNHCCRGCGLQHENIYYLGLKEKVCTPCSRQLKRGFVKDLGL